MRVSATRENAKIMAVFHSAWLLCVVLLSCGGKQSATHSGTRKGGLTAPNVSAELSDWGVSSVEDVGFVTVALLKHASRDVELTLYQIRKLAPIKERASTRVWRSEAPMMSSGAFLLSRFDRGNYNRLGGTFGSFSKLPSTGDVRLLGGTSGLRFRFRRKQAGYSGLWLHLFDDRASAEERTYLHTGSASHLSFEIRGASGGESLSLAVADREWLERGDARTIGDLSKYLGEGGVTKSWQRVLVPLSDLPSDVEHEELASLVLQVGAPSAGEIAIRNLGLLASAQAHLPVDSTASTPLSRKRRLRRAMWVWETETLLSDSALRERLLSTCQSNRISDVFLQLISAEPDSGSWDSMLGLVAELHGIGVRVEALDGSPEYAQAKHHRKALRVVTAVAASNRRQSSERSFDGLRFDIEPYLLPGFSGPSKGTILRDYLALLDKLRHATKVAGLVLGADIPFWFDGLDRYQEPTARVEGRPVSELIMDRVDNIAVMAYRTRVYGPDGVIAHAIDEIEYAEATGKQVFVGVETGALPNEHVQDFDRERRDSADRLLLWNEERGIRLAYFRASEKRALAAARAAHPKAQMLYLRSESVAPASKVTFSRNGLRSLQDATDRIGEELGFYDSTLGVAIHAFASLVQLSDRSP